MRRFVSIGARGAILCIAAMLAAGPALAQNNPYGVHTFLQDLMASSLIEAHLTWAHTLTGDGGYVKQLIYPIWTDTPGPHASWVEFTSACYARNLIPVLRIATYAEGGSWLEPPADAPGDYTTYAQAVKRVIQGLPRDPAIPLYVEVFNEPNNNYEWSWESDPWEYAHALRDISEAIRSIGDPGIKVLNAGLSPGGSYDNLDFIDAMFAAVPDLGDWIDAWATHPYAIGTDPDQNNHNGTAPNPRACIDSYMTELERLAAHMDITGLKVIATECDLGGDETTRADRMMRAFRDYWSQWPEVLAICPWEFCDPLGNHEGDDWVYPDSGTDPNGYPTHTHQVYDAVWALAKPGHTTGAISGKILESANSTPLAGVVVTASPGGATDTTDAAGNYMLPLLAPGTYTLTAQRTGFETQVRGGVAVTAATNAVEDFLMVASGTGTISGSVLEGATGLPVAGATVTVLPGGYTGQSGPDGSFTVALVPPGTYSVMASRLGWYTHTKSDIAVEVGDAINLTFFLGIGGDPGSTPLIGDRGLDEEGAVFAGVAAGWTNHDGGDHPEIYAVDTTVKYSGDGSQRISPQSGNPNNYIWNISGYSTVIPGRVYTVQAWCKTDNLVRGGQRGACVAAEFYTSDMTWVGSKYSSEDGIFLEGTNDWTLLSMQVRCPSHQQMLRMQVKLCADAVSGTAWFDNAYAGLRDISPPSAPSDVTVEDTGTGESLALTWSPPDTPDLGYFVVYRSESPGVLGEVAQDEVRDTSVVDTGLESGRTYYYTVRSVDNVGNSSSNTDQHAGTPWLHLDSETYGAGWNMTSVPAEPADPEASAVFAGLEGAGNTIANALYRYDPGTGYRLYPGEFTAVEAGRGYWLKLSYPGTTAYQAYKPEATEPVALGEGWNLIGHPQPTPVLLSACQVDDGVETKSFAEAADAGWVAPTLYYYDGAYRTVKTSGGDDDSLRPWHAYWLKALRPGLTLLVPR